MYGPEDANLEKETEEAKADHVTLWSDTIKRFKKNKKQ